MDCSHTWASHEVQHLSLEEAPAPLFNGTSLPFSLLSSPSGRALHILRCSAAYSMVALRGHEHAGL